MAKDKKTSKKAKNKKSELDEKSKKVKAKAKKKKASRDADEEDEDAVDGETKFSLRNQINDTLDDVAHKLSDADTLDDMPPMSTGSLILNLVTGGIRAAWYTNFGPEQSAKTTGTLLVLSSAISEDIPLLALRDFEGSTGNSIPYVTSIMNTNGVKITKDELFGKKDPKTGKWVVPPRVRYSASTRGVGFFNWFVSVLRRLPDKKMLNNEWWLVYEDDKEHAKLKEFADSNMPRKYGKGIYIKAEDDKLQGVVLLDSYPNMNPDYKDEDESDNSLALQARMFSKNLPRVKGYLASKKVAVIGVNQLRDVPMAMYGPKEAEPCGKAIRYNSDVRVRWYPRAISDKTPLWPEKAKKGGKEVESGIHGGKDYYKYVHISGAKNKLATADREGWIRLWTKDADGKPHGIDPVFDTLYYLWITGQLVPEGRGKKRSQLRLLFKGQKSKVIDWSILKQMILGDKKEIIEACKKAGIKPMNLRKLCFKQWASGEGEKLYAEQEKAGGVSKPEDDDDD